jgi:hypothetical protein
MIGRFCVLFFPVGEVARAFSREDRPVASAIEGGATFAAAIFADYAGAYVLLELGRTP